jgi:hypothetical protein
MSVSIPSDLVLDVMRNAPSSRTGPETAAQKLAMAGTATGPASFTDVVKGLAGSEGAKADLIVDVLDAADSDLAAGAANALSRHRTEGISPQAAFEQMFIRNMFESMLPAADSGIYGDESASSGVWRSLAADQLASVYTDAGGLGLASKLSERNSPSNPVSMPQWPYFEQTVISSFTS